MRRLLFLTLIGVAMATSSAFADHPHTCGGSFDGGCGGGQWVGEPVQHCEFLASGRFVLHRKSSASMSEGWIPTQVSARVQRICEQYGNNAAGNKDFFHCLKVSTHPVSPTTGQPGELTDAQIAFCAQQAGVP